MKRKHFIAISNFKRMEASTDLNVLKTKTGFQAIRYDRVDTWWRICAFHIFIRYGEANKSPGKTEQYENYYILIKWIGALKCVYANRYST